MCVINHSILPCSLQGICKLVKDVAASLHMDPASICRVLRPHMKGLLQ